MRAMIKNKTAGLRTVAVFEAVKGVLVLIASGLLVKLLRSDAQGAAEEIVQHFHLDPARHQPRVFVETLVDFGNAHLIALSFGALLYALVRFVEAYGLWRARAWAWGFGIISAGLYIPFELAELTKHVGWHGVAVLVTNIVIVVVLWISRIDARV